MPPSIRVVIPRRPTSLVRHITCQMRSLSSGSMPTSIFLRWPMIAAPTSGLASMPPANPIPGTSGSSVSTTTMFSRLCV